MCLYVCVRESKYICIYVCVCVYFCAHVCVYICVCSVTCRELSASFTVHLFQQNVHWPYAFFHFPFILICSLFYTLVFQVFFLKKKLKNFFLNQGMNKYKSYWIWYFSRLFSYLVVENREKWACNIFYPSFSSHWADQQGSVYKYSMSILWMMNRQWAIWSCQSISFRLSV